MTSIISFKLEVLNNRHEQFFAVADHADWVLYILWIILTNYWQIAKLGAPHYNGNHVFLVSCTQEVEVTHPKDYSSDNITTDTHTHTLSLYLSTRDVQFN